jgi:hypothetical protein
MKISIHIIVFTIACITINTNLHAQTAWELTGNAGTNSSTNFLGTTDNKPLILRTNNVARMRISNTGNIGIGLAAPVQKLHVRGNINTDSSFGYYINNIRVLHTSGLTTFAADQTNFFAGQYAGNSITDGFWNAALGYNALNANTSGGSNTACGYNALFLNTTGGGNTATGTDALHNNTQGSDNTAAGLLALFYNINGALNTAVGYAAMKNNTSGDHNTAAGSNALETNTTGNHNTAIGYNSDVNAGNLQNATSLGYNSLNTASNQVRIGNSSVTSIGGYVNWSNISDGRYKRNIKEDVPGLKFINALKPVTYNLDITALENNLHKHIYVVDKQNAEAKEKIKYSGFVAQDVEKAAKQIGYDFSGVDAPKNDKDIYALRYADFVVPLVKAVQELTAENEALKARLDKIENFIAANVRGDKEDAVAVKLTGSYLEQNIPNPFNQTTTINYHLPQNTGNALIKITDINGRTIKNITVDIKGNGQIIVNANELAAGTYKYSLIANGKLIDTKKMVLTK